MAVHPSGEQYEIGSDGTQVVAVEVGGGLRTLTAGKVDVLDGYAGDEMCSGGRGQILMPWPNRLAGGRYTFDGQDLQVPLTEPTRGNAIHGLVRWANWEGHGEGANTVAMTHRLYPSPGYPFALDLSAVYTISAQGLRVTLRAVNVGDQRCPFGAGQHPYYRVGTSMVDDALLRIPAATIYRYNNASIPTERIPVTGTPLDFRDLRSIGDTVIDMDFTDLERDADGLVHVTIQEPGGTPALDIWMDEAFQHVTAFTGDTLPPAHRRRGIAIEPMTCAPNAFNSGDGLLVLEPGDAWEGTWGVTLHW